jgi:hypothetical protein
LRDWAARGWRIDGDTLAGVRPRSRVQTIPSPGRREQKAWVYDNVPLAPAAAAAPST